MDCYGFMCLKCFSTEVTDEIPFYCVDLLVHLKTYFFPKPFSTHFTHKNLSDLDERSLPLSGDRLIMI